MGRLGLGRCIGAATALFLVLGLSPAVAFASGAPTSNTSTHSSRILADDPPPDRDGDGVTDDVDGCPDEYGTGGDGCPYTDPGPTDSDGDGVNDSSDQCPNDPGTVANNGCPAPDSDGDGIADDVDACPSLPGPYDGCPLTDLDGDGVYDDGTDQCPDQAGPADNNGCPYPDTDGDGVKDDVDGCPDTPTGENVDAVGCSLTQQDSDNDGLNDEVDQCDNTPADEEIDQNGCAESELDTDKDGVKDDKDKCAATPDAAAVDADGCPLTAVTAKKVTFTDRCGTKHDTVKVPSTRGVTYLYKGKRIAPGRHVVRGTVTVTARANKGYALSGTASWKKTLSTKACRVGKVRLVSSAAGKVTVTNREKSSMRITVGRVTRTVAAGKSKTLSVAGGRRNWVARWTGDLSAARGKVSVR